MQRVLESDNDKLTNGSLSITSFINVFGQRYTYVQLILLDIYLSSIRRSISLCIGHCISIVNNNITSGDENYLCWASLCKSHKISVKAQACMRIWAWYLNS